MYSLILIIIIIIPDVSFVSKNRLIYIVFVVSTFIPANATGCLKRSSLQDIFAHIVIRHEVGIGTSFEPNESASFFFNYKYSHKQTHKYVYIARPSFSKFVEGGRGNIQVYFAEPICKLTSKGRQDPLP